MSTELMDEHEQGERVRAWLQENGAAIVTGIAVGLALLFGWKWWENSQIEARHTAAAQYQALTDAVERSDRDAADVLVQSLVTEFDGSAYAGWARLQHAEQQLAAGELAGARETLEAAIGDANSPILADLARVRLARVRLAAGEAEPALTLLQAVDPQAFVAAVADLRGDALRSLGRSDEARQAYLQAAQALPVMSPGRRLIEMKLVDAGGTPPALES